MPSSADYKITELEPTSDHCGPRNVGLLAQVARVVELPLSLLIWLLTVQWGTLLFCMNGANSGRGFLVSNAFLITQLAPLVTGIIDSGWRFLCLRERQRPTLRLVGDHVPHVDVVITTCGEALDVIMDTVKATCAMDWPARQLRVVVADDAADKVLEKGIAGLKKDAACDLLYYARTSKTGYKAGNMNSVLAYLDSQGPVAEFSAFLDADMIPEPDFLRATVSQLVNNPKTGLAMICQRFYNIPPNDPLYQSLNAQAKRDEFLRDSIDSTWCTGSGEVFRRQEIVDIGGIPEDGIMEDVLTGFLLLGKGWEIVYCNEELQWGLVPDTLQGHVAQRRKWVVGGVHNGLLLQFGFNTALLPRLTWRQRIVCFTYAMPMITSGFVRVLSLWLFLLLVSSGQSLIQPKGRHDLRQLVLISWIIGLISSIQDLLIGFRFGYWALKARIQGYTWLEPYLIVSIVREYLPPWLAGIRLGFKPTASCDSPILERDSSARPRLISRLRIMILNQGLWYHILQLSIAAVVFRKDLVAAFAAKDMWTYLLTHSLVPGAFWDQYLALLIPVIYAILPPSMPPRRGLMERDELAPKQLDVWRPKSAYKVERWNWWILFLELPHVAFFGLGTYVCFCVVK